MNREEILEAIEPRGAQIREQFGVASLMVCGSIARDEATPQGDVDVLVDFRGPTTFLAVLNLSEFLEEVVGCRVDLVTRNGLPARMLTEIENEAVPVA